jgi:hypothetical protein
MLNGIQLTLMIGPAVPLPVPQPVLEVLKSVRVTSTAGKGSGFQLTFTLSNQSPLHTLFLLSGGSPIPLVRVLIVVTINSTPEVLMDGMMTNHEVKADGDSGNSTLTVTGEDLSVVMDYIDFSGIPYPAMPREIRVLAIVAKYAVLGIVPVVIPSPFLDVDLPITSIKRQNGKDLEYVRKLAAEVGYVFHVEPGPVPGVNFAYWGPEIKVGVPQPALSTNMDAHTNVESLSFNYDARKKKLPIVFVQNEATKIPLPIPIPDISPISPPLGLTGFIPLGIQRLKETAKMTPVQAILYGIAKSSQYSEAVTGTGSLDVLRYGRILKSGRLVGVRGAGPAFDGLHYVSSVTHKLERGQFKQDFTLSRNGLLSTVPEVPV